MAGKALGGNKFGTELMRMENGYTFVRDVKTNSETEGWDRPEAGTEVIDLSTDWKTHNL